MYGDEYKITGPPFEAMIVAVLLPVLFGMYLIVTKDEKMDKEIHKIYVRELEVEALKADSPEVEMVLTMLSRFSAEQIGDFGEANFLAINRAAAAQITVGVKHNKGLTH